MTAFDFGDIPVSRACVTRFRTSCKSLKLSDDKCHSRYFLRYLRYFYLRYFRHSGRDCRNPVAMDGNKHKDWNLESHLVSYRENLRQNDQEISRKY